MAPSPVAVLTAPLRLDPLVTAPLLLALIYYPEKLREICPANLLPILESSLLANGLKGVLGLGIVRKINRALSQLAANNWKSGKKFVPSQEIILISGGSSGIGNLMARSFAKKGAKVIVLDVQEGKSELPANAFFYHCDVTDSSKIHEVAAQIRKEHGDPTVVINNAGIGSSRTILNSSEALIRRTFEVNIMAHYWMIREFLPDMIKKDYGHIVTIASMASFIVHAQNVDYSCTKAGALAFHEGLASELRNKYNAPNVRTTVVHPGWIRTPLIESLTTRKEFTESILEPEEVSEAVVRQVLSGKGAQIILPERLAFISTMRAWPTWIQVAARNMVAPLFNYHRGPGDSFLHE